MHFEIRMLQRGIFPQWYAQSKIVGLIYRGSVAAAMKPLGRTMSELQGNDHSIFDRAENGKHTALK